MKLHLALCTGFRIEETYRVKTSHLEIDILLVTLVELGFEKWVYEASSGRCILQSRCIPLAAKCPVVSGAIPNAGWASKQHAVTVKIQRNKRNTASVVVPKIPITCSTQTDSTLW